VKNSVYSEGENLYLNLTSLCPTECVFCVKEPAGRRFHGNDLTLDREPELEEVWSAVLDRTAKRPFDEFVFCGYGESTYRIDVVLELTRRLKRCYPRSKRRLNTVGLGNTIWERNIAPELAATGLTSVSVSLNTADPEQWLKLHRPRLEMREKSFESVLAFIRACLSANIETTVTAVELPGVDLGAVQRLAAALGAAYRARPMLTAEKATNKTE
jgi:TatD family-associated radical SAM protein